MASAKLSKFLNIPWQRLQLSREETPAPTIIIPLYIYPEPNAWNPLHECIQKNRSTHFLVIVNPGNGPGPGPIPDANYLSEIPKLNVYSNVEVVGYVHTSFTQRDHTAVVEDIRTYSKWAEQAQHPHLRISGIFVDETPNQFDARAERYLSDLTKFAKSCEGFGGNKLVIHNPGCIPSPSYTALADITVVFEDTWPTFNIRYEEGLFDLHKIFGNLDRDKFRRENLAILIHSVPQDFKPEQIKAFIKRVKQIAGNVFVTDLDENYYSNWSQKWLGWVKAIAA